MNQYPAGDGQERQARQASGRFQRYCRRHAFRPGILRTVIILAAAVFLALGFFGIRNLNIFAKVTKLNLEDIGELATQAGYFTSVQTIRKSREVLGLEVPGTQSNYVYSYDGTIKAGYDFSKITAEVDEKNHEITVSLPACEILSTEIDEDSFVLYNDGANPFTSLKLEDVDKSNAELKKAARETAIKNGILENARTNAELLIRGFLAGLYDMKVYTVRFTDQAEPAVLAEPSATE